MLSELIDVSDVDVEAIAAASYLNNKQRSEKMTELYNDYKKWKSNTIRESPKNSRSDLTLTKVSEITLVTTVVTVKLLGTASTRLTIITNRLTYRDKVILETKILKTCFCT